MPSISSKSSQSNPQIGNIAEFLQDPLKHAVSVMEKKLRNLEKRKIKLLETKKKAEGGNELNDDQKKALENLKVVENSLDLVKELSKNMAYLDGEYTKHLKRDQKRIKITEAAQSDQYGKQLVHRVVEVQAILSDMSEFVRPDFLNGVNSACKLTKDDFDNLDVFYELVNPSIDPTIDLSKVNKLSVRVKEATEHLIKVVEGKDLPALDNGTTYKELQALISRIKLSGYFEKDKVNGLDENVNHIVPESADSELHEEHEDHEDHEKIDHKEAENEEEEINEVTSPFDEQLPVLDGVDLPPEVQRTPNEEHFNFLSESEILVHGDGQQASLNPVSPEFVPRNFQLPSGEVYENGVADNSDAGWEQAPAQEPGWQSVENQNFHSGGGFRGNRGNRGDHRGGRGFGGRGGRGSRGGNGSAGGNFRGGNKQDGHRGGNRGGRGGEFRGGNRGGFRGGNRGGPRGAGRGGSRENKPQQQQ